MISIEQVIQKAIAYDEGDARRIHHFLKVYAYADTIGRLEGLSEDEQSILQTAAVLHDIGIHKAEEKYGSSSGHFQEIEGPAPARAILEELGAPAHFIDRVTFLIAHHHTYSGVDGADYQILLEADFLVNAYEDQLKPEAIQTFKEKVFRTKAGLELLKHTYGV
ncbi:HD domain-containing protein [uncultured Megasphaera sp.]|uniref:HD domain-containing protein n=1 Tax=uncultured Megasphaera sp. TaxID=165188 RepID=UPI0025F32F35|nr:HD domain-containing protein [uncultured Megasphaera sp.]